jgi:hypothetical protein
LSNQPSAKLFVQAESATTRQPVSENLVQTMAGSINFGLEKNFVARTFTLNGSYKNAAGRNAVDGLLVFQWNAEIFNIVIVNSTVGLSGTTELDLKYSTNPGAAFNSIFTTTPKITSSAAAYSYLGVGQTLAGCTAPVLSSNPFNVVAGGALRLDVISTMTGARDAEIIVYYRPR